MNTTRNSVSWQISLQPESLCTHSFKTRGASSYQDVTYVHGPHVTLSQLDVIEVDVIENRAYVARESSALFPCLSQSICSANAKSRIKPQNTCNLTCPQTQILGHPVHSSCGLGYTRIPSICTSGLHLYFAGGCKLTC